MRFSAMIMLLLIGLGSAGDGSQASPASADYQAGFARGLELGMEIVTLLSAAPFNSNALELFNQRAAEFNGEVDLVFGNRSDLSKQYRLQPFGLHANNTVAASGTDINQTAVNQTAVNQTAINQTAINQTAINRTAINRTAINQTAINQTAINQTAVNQTAVNQTAVNQTAVNQTAINQTAINQTAINQTADNHASKNSAAVQGIFSGKYSIIFENESEKARGSSIPKLGGNATIEKEYSVDEDLGDILKDWSGNAEVPPDFMTGMPGPESV